MTLTSTVSGEIKIRVVDEKTGSVLIDDVIESTNIQQNNAALKPFVYVRSTTGTTPKLFGCNTIYCEGQYV